jgi:hypothetical protein
MIECASCGTVAVVLDRSGAWDLDDELVVVCAECAPDEVSSVLESTLFAATPAAPALARSAHARAA